MTAPVFLTYVGGRLPVQERLVPGYVLGTARQFQLDLVAAADHPGPVLYADVAGWVEVSLDGGNVWTPVGTTPATGVNLGAVTAGSRRTLDLRVNAAAGPTLRRQVVGLALGLGT